MKFKTFEVLRKIDVLIAESLNQKYPTHLPRYLDSDIAQIYFYDRIEGKDWLELVFDHEEFKNPPYSKKDEKGNLYFPFWPQIKFLQREVKRSEDIGYKKLIAKVLFAVQLNDNHYVCYYILSIVNSLPLSMSIMWKEKVVEWLEKQDSILYNPLAEELGKFSVRLIEAGKNMQAIKICKKILEIKKDPNFDYNKKSTRLYEFSKPSPKLFISLREYENMLKKYISSLTEKTPERVVILLCDLLVDAIKWSQKKISKTKNVKNEDYSFIWRPTIEDSEQKLSSDIRGILVDSIRDESSKAINIKGREIIYLVEKYKKHYSIFQRIGLHLRRYYYDVDPVGTSNLLTDIMFYQDQNYRYEVYHILKNCFYKLDKNVRDKYLNYVRCEENQPDPEKFCDRIEKNEGQRPPFEVGEKHRRKWIYKMLLPISKYLSEKQKKEFQFDNLENEFHEIKHPDFTVYRYTTRGVESTITSGELLDKRNDDIIDYLRKWKKEEKIGSPERYDLCRILSEAVVSDIDRFIKLKEGFKDLEPAYVAALISGFRDAVKKEMKIDWASVISFCEWVIEQNILRQEPEDEYGDYDYHWGTVWLEIAYLLQAGFGLKDAEIPIQNRNGLWEIIQALVKLKVPEFKIDDLTIDPKLTPIMYETVKNKRMPNTEEIKSEGFDCAVQYALWVRRHEEMKERKSDKMPISISGFRQLINSALENREKMSASYPERFGRWLPWLNLLEPEWTQKNLENIFPAKNEEMRSRAWMAYITQSNAYNELFKLLRPHYLWAIDQLEKRTIDKLDKSEYLEDSFWSAGEERLTQELMVFYMRELISFDDKDRILEEFFEKAPENLRAEAIKFIGPNLRDENEQISEIHKKRLMDLWNWRVEQFESGKVKDGKDELGAFAWWFASKQLNPEWTFRQLKKVLNFGVKLDMDFLVMDRLVELSSEHQGDTLEVLELLINGDDRENFRLHDTKDVKRIFENIAQTEDLKVLKKAWKVVNDFGAKGYPWMYELREVADRIKVRLEK